MRIRILIGLLLLSLICGPPAQAKRRQRIAYATAVSLVATLSLGCLATATALRVAAPNVDTLMTFKRYDTASSDLFTVGGVLTITGGIFALMGGLFFDLKKEEASAPAALWVAPSGTGLALGGSF